MINNLQRGGAERLTLDICRELNKRSQFETALIVFDPKNEYPEMSDTVNIIHSNNKVYLKFPLRVIVETDDLKRIYLDFKPHVVHSHLFYADYVTRELIEKKTAYFSHIHGTTTQYEQIPTDKRFSKQHLIRTINRRRIIKRYVACHNQFIANSNDTKQYIIDSLNWDKQHIHLLVNGIDLSKFTYQNKFFPGKEIRLVTTGSLIERKNHAFLIAVVVKLREMGFDPELEILGEGPLHDLLKSKIREAGIENNIRLTGMVTDVETHLANAHLYLHAATYEPFGLAIVEALACGLPVVCLDAKGNREIIEQGKNGFLLKEKDANVFAEHVLKIVKDETTYLHFSKNAFSSARQYDIKEYVNRLEKLYENEMAFRKVKYR